MFLIIAGRIDPTYQRKDLELTLCSKEKKKKESMYLEHMICAEKLQLLALKLYICWGYYQTKCPTRIWLGKKFLGYVKAY